MTNIMKLEETGIAGFENRWGIAKMTSSEFKKRLWLAMQFFEEFYMFYRKGVYRFKEEFLRPDWLQSFFTDQ